MAPRSARTTSTRYGRPHRPRAIALANALGSRLGRRGPAARLTVDALLEAARRGTGLEDFGQPDLREPLGVLVDSIEREAQLHTVGRLITRSRLGSLLCHRLRAEAAFRAHREITTQPVRAPVVVSGLQRTGTTLLHRLLAADPAHRSLAAWEGLQPAPAPRRWWQLGDPRIRQGRLAEHALRYLAPDFFAIHPAEADAPEEDVVLLDCSLWSTTFEATLRVPAYASWLETQDQLGAYQIFKRLLQLLQWQRPPDRWVLKTPHHLEWLDTLLEVFPDAKIIQTHRDPLKTMPSLFSMIAHARGIFSDQIDPHEVALHWLRKDGRLIERAMQTRERRGDGSFLDVSYYDLVADPVGQLERIYDFIERPFTSAIADRVRAARQHNRQHKHGRHRYQLSDFGVSPEDVEATFRRYRQRFDVPHE